MSSLKRHPWDAVLPQYESRIRVWNPDTLEWEAGDERLTNIQNELTEMRRLLEEMVVAFKTVKQ